ncbi:ubiquitin-like modifier hub1 [Coemansia sp. RSA 922]|nr:ubiquitin-like modifier hub1 [Coemansia sp. RSA 922]
MYKSRKRSASPTSRRALTNKDQAPVPAGTIQVTFDDRSGKKVTLPCLPNDDIGSIKKMVAAVIGTKANKFVLKRGAQTFKDQGSLDLYEVHDKTSVEILYT